MPAPVAVLVEVDGELVFQAYIAYCAICRGPPREKEPQRPTVPHVAQAVAKTVAGYGGFILFLFLAF